MIVERKPLFGGEQIVHRFGNGWGASVIRHSGSYGGPGGLWELGVIRFENEGPEWHLNYDTPVTSDVIGWLTDEDVQRYLDEIEVLPGALTEAWS